MENWRDCLDPRTRELLRHYEAQGILVIRRECPHPYHGRMAEQVEAWQNDVLLAASDPVGPIKTPEVMRGCTAQMLVRLGAQLRETAARQ